jgi:hypothetical protein
MENSTFDLQKYNDMDLSEAFTVVLEKGTFKQYIVDIATLICNNELNRENLDTLLKERHTEYQEAKLDLLDLLLSYIEIVVNTHVVTEKERHNIEMLKLYFKVKEGDFYKHRYDEIKSICQKQFARTYSDNYIDHGESVFRVEMQGIFDLSFAQMDEFKQDEIIRALREGASIVNLDTDKIPEGIAGS